MVKCLQLILFIPLFFSLTSQAQFTSVSYSIQAHQDDWQLFMGSKIMADLNVSGRKVVFITLTAGDQSCGTCTYGNGPLYLARENGAVYSSKFAADLSLGTAPTATPVASTVTINGHSVTKYVYKNTVNYFLRLPDGDLTGAGFPNNGNQSLFKLKTGVIAAINVIGHTTTPPINGPAAFTYTYSQLTATIRQIINDEKIPGTQSFIHAANTNTAYNINDHSDHLHSSIAAQDAATVAAGFGWIGINGYMDYHSSSQGANLSPTDHANASIIFGLEVLGLSEKEYQNDFANHRQWLPMDYFQVLRNPAGTAPFAFGETGGTAFLSDLTEIPLIISVTSPAAVNKDIAISISPYEPGQLSTTIFDMAGNKVYELNTMLDSRDAMIISLKNAVKTKGTYILKTILNEKFIDSRKIVVE